MAGDRHLYMILHPNHSLIASQLDPERFIRHYIQGSTRYLEGRLVFAEVDESFRNPYFGIDGAFAQLKPHEDGSPKATKFIASYRVLEHMDLDAIGTLYYCNSTGDYVALEPGTEEHKSRGDEMRIILEINPVRFIVLTKHDFAEFAGYITDSANPKGAPKAFYTQLELSVDEFTREYDESPFVSSYIPGIHPARLRDAVAEVKRTPGKLLKGISLDCPIDRISYKLLRHGFMFAQAGKTKFYPLLPLDEVERRFYKFWKTM